MKAKIYIVALVLGLIVLESIGYSQGCSQCKLLAEQGSGLDENSFGSNINYGILFLMAIPYVIFLLFFRKRVVRLFKSLKNTP